MAPPSLALRRLQWLQEYIASGYAVSATVSSSAQSEKIKFMISHDKYAYVDQRGILSLVQHLSDSADRSVVVDKGHFSHSNQQSVVEFWIKYRGEENKVPQAIPLDVSVEPRHELPPPAPPPFEAEEAKSKLDLLAESMTLLQQHVQANSWYTYCIYNSLENSVAILAGNQNVTDIQNASIETLRSWVNSEPRILEKLDSLSLIRDVPGNVATSPSNTVDLANGTAVVVQTAASAAGFTEIGTGEDILHAGPLNDVAVQMPAPTMKKYRFVRKGIDAATQITAREFNDEMLDSPQSSDAEMSEGDAEMSDGPHSSAQDYDEDSEELLEIPQAEQGMICIVAGSVLSLTIVIFLAGLFAKRLEYVLGSITSASDMITVKRKTSQESRLKLFCYKFST